MVAFSLGYITPGLPSTSECDGTSKSTKELAAMSTLFPIEIPPQTKAPVPITQLFPIIGTPSRFPLLTDPIVEFLNITQLSPITALGLIVIPLG